MKRAAQDVRKTGMAGRFRTTRLTVERLIVLVPAQDVNGVTLARRIRALAAPCGLGVLLVCAIDGDEHGGSAERLRLATLASFIQDDHVEVAAQVFTRLSWVGAVQRLYRPGDVVLCCVDHTIPTVANGRQPVWRVLQWLLGLPVFVLAGM